MRWLEQMNENIKRGIRSWLNVIPASPYNIQINELLDFETSAIRNRIWYRGDSNELSSCIGKCMIALINISSGQVSVRLV